jgi:predicted PurR-regulated permease PerM
VLAFILPIGRVAAIVVKEAVEAITFVRNSLRDSGIEGLIARLPGPLQSMVQRALEMLPHGEEQLQSLAGQGATAAAAVGGVLSATGKAVLQTALMLIALFFLLVDGEKLVYWLSGVIPSRRFKLVELLQDFRRVSVAVMVSSVVTAGAQSIVAAIGYLIARAPNVMFFTLVTFFTAFVPAVGAASVSLGLSVLMFLSGRIYAAIFLLVWGVLVVGLVDNIVKPLIIKTGLELHGAIVFFALLGGLAAFGAIGLIAGPVIVVFFMSVVRMSSARIDVVPTEVVKKKRG